MMVENSENLRRLESCQWARNIGSQEASAETCGSIEQIADRLETDPDGFLAPPYEDPYEALCISDHEHAARLSGQVDQDRVSRIARTAYLETWEVIPVPEICGLVSDDAETLATLLLTQHEPTSFSSERLEWYLGGRIPFGYRGDHPHGRWLIL